MFSDSQSVIHLSKNQGFHDRTKHIDVRLHFIRDVVASKRVRVEKISTEDNPVDFLTKTVPSIKFQKCVSLIGVTVLDEG